MAKHTDITLRNKTFYQVFPRQHSNKQNFLGVIDDLDRLKDLGVDVLYLLPIHPIGLKDRKGAKGSPYAIIDYYQIHQDLGSLEDFVKLIDKAHQKGLKVMIDIVINHTSRDSLLTLEKPEWFYKKENGDFANRIGDWSDITDLNFDLSDVWNYFFDVLNYWAKIVDGFRCDVAPLLPIDFWIEARKRVDQVNPNLIWLTESVEPGFITYLRGMDYDCSSDSQMYQAFDICYDYDIFTHMDAYLKDGKLLSRWLEEINRQEYVYPKNYIKLRSFENHDQKRLRSKVRDEIHFKQMIALMFFIKGAPFIYAGQEHQIDHAPSLFEDDLVPWQKEKSIEDFIKILIKLKKDEIFAYGHYHSHHTIDVAVLSYRLNDRFLCGIFNLEPQSQIKVPLLDGKYMNLMNQKEVIVKNQHITLGEDPIIIETTQAQAI